MEAETAAGPADLEDRADPEDLINVANAGELPIEDAAVMEEEGTTIANAKVQTPEKNPHRNASRCVSTKRNLRSH